MKPPAIPQETGTAAATAGARAGERAGTDVPAVELTVVIPCLDEAETLPTCLAKAQKVIAEHGIAAEIVVADNGSVDGSQEIAARMGARVVDVEARGYGNALMAGIRAARGRYVVMADADDSYDLLELPKFVDKLPEG